MGSTAPRLIKAVEAEEEAVVMVGMVGWRWLQSSWME
jgi:hypothetical protein